MTTSPSLFATCLIFNNRVIYVSRKLNSSGLKMFNLENAKLRNFKQRPSIGMLNSRQPANPAVVYILLSYARGQIYFRAYFVRHIVFVRHRVFC